MDRHEQIVQLVQQNFRAEQLECRTDQLPDVSHESEKKLREYIDKIRSVNENVYERCYMGEWVNR